MANVRRLRVSVESSGCSNLSSSLPRNRAVLPPKCFCDSDKRRAKGYQIGNMRFPPRYVRNAGIKTQFLLYSHKKSMSINEHAVCVKKRVFARAFPPVLRIERHGDRRRNKQKRMQSSVEKAIARRGSGVSQAAALENIPRVSRAVRHKRPRSRPVNPPAPDMERPIYRRRPTYGKTPRAFQTG